jgi:hypothetical protein
MIAGTIELGKGRFRVQANDAAWDAVGRLAAAASLGMDGREGLAETTQFLRSVIDRRDWPRFARAAARAPEAEYKTSASTCIGLILRAAEQHPDPSMRSWGTDFKAAAARFQAGDQTAFAELAGANMLKYGAEP